MSTLAAVELITSGGAKALTEPPGDPEELQEIAYGRDRGQPLDSDDSPEQPLMMEPPGSDEETWILDPSRFAAGQKTDEDLRGVKRKVGRFYRQQSDLVKNFFFLDKALAHDSDHDEAEKQEAQERRVKIALYLSIGANLCIVGMQLFAAISSGSIAILATMMDSILDQVVSVVIFSTSYLIKRRNPYVYPAGKARLEPIGVIILSCIMATGMLQLITRSLEVLAAGHTSFTLAWPEIAVLIANIVIKLVLFLYCRSIRGSSSVAALAQDHINDVILLTLGTGCALVGFYVYWIVDPLGGLLVSIYICLRWLRTGLRQTRDLTGKSAPPEFLQMMTYACLNHDRRIVKIDTVRAFHLGPGYMVEIDIVLPEEMILKEAHDIGQTLQDKLERISQVERCFVHLDYECDHRPEHVPDKKITLDLGEDD